MGFGKDGKGVIIRESRSQALGGLANNVAIAIGTKLATLERYRMIKLELWASMIGLTGGEGDALIIGIADGDLSIAEIEAAIESNGPLGPNDAIQAPIAERLVILLGGIDHEIGTEALFHNNEGGFMMSKTIRWTFARTKSWEFFVYNLGTTLTSGSTVQIRAKSFGVWVT